jgi:hypothetical protein
MKTDIILTTEMVIENNSISENKMIVFPDRTGIDLVGLMFINRDNLVKLSDDQDADIFHINKFNVGCLIDYLTRIYNEME